METAAIIQETIEATQIAETIKYGRRALDAGRGALGCEIAGGWMAAQWEAAKITAEFLLGTEIRNDMAAWQLKRAAKIAKDRAAEAKDGKRAAGTQRQIRMALAA